MRPPAAKVRWVDNLLYDSTLWAPWLSIGVNRFSLTGAVAANLESGDQEGPLG